MFNIICNKVFYFVFVSHSLTLVSLFFSLSLFIYMVFKFLIVKRPVIEKGSRDVKMNGLA